MDECINCLLQSEFSNVSSLWFYSSAVYSKLLFSELFESKDGSRINTVQVGSTDNVPDGHWWIEMSDCQLVINHPTGVRFMNAKHLSILTTKDWAIALNGTLILSQYVISIKFENYKMKSPSSSFEVTYYQTWFDDFEFKEKIRSPPTLAILNFKSEIIMNRFPQVVINQSFTCLRPEYKINFHKSYSTPPLHCPPTQDYPCLIQTIESLPSNCLIHLHLHSSTIHSSSLPSTRLLINI